MLAQIFRPSAPGRLALAALVIGFNGLCAGGAQPPAASAPAPTDSPFGTELARAVAANFPMRGALGDMSVPPRSPQEAVATFKLMDGLKADVVLSEPQITQPVFLNFDERGRLWVVQFIQYPYPAGLKIMDLGGQFHAVYDKVPPPPPHHVRGRDIITICEDTAGDGTFASRKVFLDGLNLVSAVERGRGGVWVLNPPYLLFYPDADNDDVPDGDPVVHLAGFGLEDTHAVANSLRWGPDGWLWGAQGSGVSSKIRRPGIDADGKAFAFQGQAIWRYHPERRIFELFAEGGGNTFSLVIDAKGRVFSGTNGGSTRGYHYEQGAYYRKNWGEHGYLTNPYTFGYFEPMAHNWKSPRFTHTYLIYEEGRLGEAFEGRIIGPNALQHRIDLAERMADGSTYRTKDLTPVLETDDRWFRPVDIKAGPDGAIYVADWYDTRLTHTDPRDNWDRKHGRVYRLRAADSKPGVEKFDLAKKTSPALVELLSHRQLWFRSTALRVLADRRDRSVIARLDELARRPDNPHALDAFWALHLTGGFSVNAAVDFLRHPQPEVRRWAVRLIGDREQPIGTETTEALVQMARAEPDVQARAQLAATARRLPGAIALPVIFSLMARTEDASDPHIPLMVWWALERLAESERTGIVAALATAAPWASPMAKKTILPLLARRYASHLTPENQQTLARLARNAPESGRALLRQGVAEAFEGRELGQLSSVIETALFNEGGANFSDPAQMALAIKRGDQNAIVAAMGFVAREEPRLAADRVRVIHALADARAAAAASVLLSVLSASRDQPVREAALAALGRFDRPQLVSEILRAWSGLDPGLRLRALELLVSRPSWAKDFFRKVGYVEMISKRDVPDEILRRARLLGDAEIDAMIDRYFGQPKVVASADKQRRIEQISNVLAGGDRGNPRAGRAIFETRCTACHMLHGRGGQIGPDLTGYERANVANMLLNTVDPNAAIREGYTAYQINTHDGRTLVGFIDDRDANRVVLRDLSGVRTPIARPDIKTETALPQSLMPEGLLEGLTEQELRDFFAYLTAPTDPGGTPPGK